MNRRTAYALLAAVLLLAAGLFYLGPPPVEDAPRRSGPDARPSEWAFAQRTFPHGTWDRQTYRTALEETHRRRAASKRGAALGTWHLAGPTNIGGRVSDVAFDPANPDVIYAAAATGGVFKSEDRGATWRPIFDDQAVLNIGDIAVDPTDPQVLYVGTGEANGGQNNFLGGGLFKSTDGGATWHYSGLDSTDAIARILVDPANPQRVFAAAVGAYFAPNPQRGVYRSDDGGATWETVLFLSDSTGAIDLVMHPRDPSTLYAAMWERVRRLDGSHFAGPTSGIWKTTDGGDTWQPLGPETGLPDASQRDVGRIGLAISESDPDVLYALYSDGFEYLSLFRTDDGGASWRDLDPDRRVSFGTGTFGWYLGQVRVHPTEPDHVFALDIWMMRSENAGVSWNYHEGSPALHVDHHALAFHPTDPDFVVAGHDGGISISENGGRSWRAAHGLPITQFYEIEIDPNHPERLYGGTQDNWHLRTFDQVPGTWERLRRAFAPGGDGFYVNVAEENSDFIYVEAQFGGLQKSSNGGQTFQSIDVTLAPLYVNRASPPDAEPRNWSTPFIIDPNDSAVLYVGTDRVYRSLTRGTFWKPISPSLTGWQRGDRLGTLTTLAVAPSNSNVLYAGTDNGRVWISQDYGTTWTRIDDGLPFRWITRVVVDPFDENTAYVTFSGLKWRDPTPHVFRTRDAGATWEDITGDLPETPVNALAIDPNNPDVLYLGGDFGAFVSFEGGGRWEVLGEGLPTVAVYDLKIDPTGRRLVAGTHGRSMYTLTLPSVPTAVADVPRRYTVDLRPNYPNPFRSITTIPYHLDEGGAVRLAVYDVLGRVVSTLVDERQPAGAHEARWDGRDDRGLALAAGVYFCTLTMPERRGAGKTRQLVLIR